MFAALQSHAWAYPALEVVHILGIALLVGNLVLVEFRVFGAGAALPAGDLARLSLPIALAGFAMVLGSGLLMFSTQVDELLANAAFRLKMVLLLAAGCNAAWFHKRKSLSLLDRTARAQMLVSTLLWIAIVACGRWIAYR